MKQKDATMTVEPRALAEHVTRMASDKGSKFFDDISLLACWVEQGLILIVFRSNLMRDARRALGIVYDPADPAKRIDVEELAFEIYEYEMVEPHLYTNTCSSQHDAIHWRVVGSSEVPARFEKLLIKAATEESTEKYLRRLVPARIAGTAVLSGPSFARRGAQFSRESTEHGSFSPLPGAGQKTKFSYISSAVDASVDGTPVILRPFPFSAGTDSVSVPLIASGDGCQLGRANTFAKFVVGHRGGCSFEQKYDVARREGAAGLVITSDERLPDARWQSPRINLTEIPILVCDEPESIRLLVDGRALSVSFHGQVISSPSD
ncbi:PA domain-containing protein [Gordonia sputi]|uniref:PA domain-containing protein n=1 Tax=Gordonia sputi TaxID=36823 RepID=UPI00226F59A0|nr:PA domain-containing protein [Gordonia sputi]